MELRFVISLIIAIIVIVFAIMNAAPVPVNIFFWKYELSLALLIFISAALGAIIVLILSQIKQYHLKKHIKELTKENQNVSEKNEPQKHHQKVDIQEADKESTLAKEEIAFSEEDKISADD